MAQHRQAARGPPCQEELLGRCQPTASTQPLDTGGHFPRREGGVSGRLDTDTYSQRLDGHGVFAQLTLCLLNCLPELKCYSYEDFAVNEVYRIWHAKRQRVNIVHPYCKYLNTYKNMKLICTIKSFQLCYKHM